MKYSLIKPLNKEYSIIEQILTNRGISIDKIEKYLNANEESVLHPLLLDNMIDGIQMLMKHIHKENDIMIQVDSDCDGMTSAAALINYLYYLFPAYVQNHITYRLHTDKHHGIIEETVSQNVKLVIAPDASSNDYDIHKKLKERGIDVLVLDHHEAEEVSKYACVINNQLCNYPNKTLSGVGIVYKFCSCIDSYLKTNHSEKILDLVSLGMIADMIDVRECETRYLIDKGLKNISNPFFKEMVSKQEYSLRNDGITPFGIAFYIVPYINATIRVGSPEEKRILFESMLDFKAHDLINSTKRGESGQTETRVEQACRTCSNIKNKQTRLRDSNVELIEKIIKEKGLLNNKVLIVPTDFEMDVNLTGLIANQLMSKYQRPVILLHKKENLWEGSGRGYEKSDLHNFKDFVNNSKLIEYGEGHQGAFGIGIKDSNLNSFIEYCNNQLKNYDFSSKYLVDYIYDISNMNPNDILKIAELKSIYGQNLEEPLIAIENIKITSENLKLMSENKNPTLKISLFNGLDLIKFKSSKEEYESLLSDGCVVINVVGKCNSNEWNGKCSPQITIEDYEVISKMNYYF